MTALREDTYFLGEGRKIRYNTLGRGPLRDAWRARSGGDEVVDQIMGVGG
jgi:hypothetical protein